MSIQSESIFHTVIICEICYIWNLNIENQGSIMFLCVVNLKGNMEDISGIFIDMFLLNLLQSSMENI